MLSVMQCATSYVSNSVEDVAANAAAVVDAPAGDVAVSVAAASRPKNIVSCLISLDRKTGRENWRRVAATQVPHEGHHRDHGYASGSPVTDGEHIIVSFGSRGLYCYDMKGKLQWKKDFGDMRTRNSFGEGTSPALHGDTVVLLWDHEGDSALYALDKKTGKLKWKTDRNEASGWCTPVVTIHDGVTQVIVNGTRAVRSYQLSDGKLLWQCSGQTSNAIPSVVVDENFRLCDERFPWRPLGRDQAWRQRRSDRQQIGLVDRQPWNTLHSVAAAEQRPHLVSLRQQRRSPPYATPKAASCWSRANGSTASAVFTPRR